MSMEMSMDRVEEAVVWVLMEYLNGTANEQGVENLLNKHLLEVLGREPTRIECGLAKSLLVALLGLTKELEVGGKDGYGNSKS